MDKPSSFGYKHKDIDLREYCQLDRIEYKSITRQAHTLRKLKKIEDCQKYIDELINFIDMNSDLSFNNCSLKCLCFFNGINYVNTMIYIYDNVGNYKSIGEDLIKEALLFSIKLSPSANSIENLIYPSEDKSKDYLQTIQNNFLLKFGIDFDSLMYNDQPLKEICNKFGYDTEDINKKIKNYVYRHKTCHINDVVKEVIDNKRKNKKRRSNYGLDVDRLCLEKNIDPKELDKSITYKHFSWGKKVTKEELYKRFFKMYEGYENLLYNGQPLPEYLKKQDVSIYSVVSYIDLNKDRLTGYTKEELIDMAIYCELHEKTVYFYNKEPIHVFCKRYGIRFKTFISFIKTTESKNPDLTLKEVIEKCVKEVEPLTKEECNYKGLSLVQLSSFLGLTYGLLFCDVINETNKGIEIGEALNKAAKKHFDKNMTVNGQHLVDYCIDKKYDFREILSLIGQVVEREKVKLAGDHIRKPNVDITEDMVNEALSAYEFRRNPIYIDRMVNFLKTRTKQNMLNLYKVNEFLNVDNYLVTELMVRGFTPYQAVMTIYYFHNKYTTNNYKSITDDRLIDIINLIELLKDNNSEKSAENINDFFLLFKLQKCRLYDVSERIFELCSEFIDGIMVNYSNSGLTFVDDINPYDTIKGLILRAIDNCNYTGEETIYSFIVNYVITGLNLSSIGISPKEYVLVPKKEDK